MKGYAMLSYAMLCYMMLYDAIWCWSKVACLAENHRLLRSVNKTTHSKRSTVTSQPKAHTVWSIVSLRTCWLCIIIWLRLLPKADAWFV